MKQTSKFRHPNNLPILTTIERMGQAYVDEPVYVKPKMMSEIEYSIARLFNNAEVVARRTPQPILLAYQHIKLNWIKPNMTRGTHADACNRA